MLKYVTNVRKKEYCKKYEINSSETDYSEMNTITINKNITNQIWLGLGGAVTQSSTYNYLKLSEIDRQNFLKDYFSKDGLNLRFVRLPIASCDFSPKPYQYISEGKKLNLEEDEKLIFPLLNDINNNYKVEFLSSPWSPPTIWKENKKLFGGDKLVKEKYNDYAEYLVDYIIEYKKRGIDIEYISIQNEPFANQLWESCKFTIEEQKDFIYNFLIPCFKKNNLTTRILLWDHNKENLYNVVKNLYKENIYIAGVCFHWYSGNHFEQIKLVKNNFPDLLLVNSESCTGYSLRKKGILKGAELLLEDIIGDINSGTNAYLNWNLLLDFFGGPNHKFNFCNAPIMLKANNRQYNKNYIYYYLKHIALVPEKSCVIETSLFTSDLSATSFKKDNSIYTVIINKSEKDYRINIFDGTNLIKDKIEKHSIVTYII